MSKSEEGNRMRDVSRLCPNEEGSLDRCLLYRYLCYGDTGAATNESKGDYLIKYGSARVLEYSMYGALYRN